MKDQIDPSAGLELLVKIGEQVNVNQPLAKIYGHPSLTESVSDSVLDAITLSEGEVPKLPLVVERVTIDTC